MRPSSRPRAAALALPLGLGLAAAACRSPDPRKELAVSGLETYWAVDPAVGDTQYLAPVVRFRLDNRSARSRSIQAMATFRRKGEGPAWSAAWAQVSPVGGKPLAPGQDALVVLKPEGEGRYTYRGTVNEMFQHPEFKDVTAEVFLRVGSSSWTSFQNVEVERRLGSQTVGDAFR